MAFQKDLEYPGMDDGIDILTLLMRLADAAAETYS